MVKCLAPEENSCRGAVFQVMSGSIIYNSVFLKNHPELRHQRHGGLLEGFVVCPQYFSENLKSISYEHTGPGNTALLKMYLGYLAVSRC